MSNAQKIIKYFGIAFAVCLIVGILVGIYQFGSMIIHMMVDDSDDSHFNMNSYPDHMNVLHVDLHCSKLVIKQGSDLKVENNSQSIKVNQKQNQLFVQETDHHFFDRQTSEVIIHIPSSITFDEVMIDAGTGNIKIERLKTKELTLELGAGKMDLDYLTVSQSANIDGGAGEVVIDHADIKNLDLDVGVGKFTLNSILKGKNEIDAGVGSLNIYLLDSIKNYSIYAEKGIGSIYLNGSNMRDESTYGNGNYKIDIDGGVGNINIKSHNGSNA